jgi:hypothetical protein
LRRRIAALEESRHTGSGRSIFVFLT